jgi:hypothetical protein
LIGIVLKEGIKVEVSKKMEKWAGPRITVCRPRGHQKKEKVNQYRGKLASQPSTSVPQASGNLAAAECHL